MSRCPTSVAFVVLICAATPAVFAAGNDSDWTIVKSLVIPRPQPKDANYVVTTDTLLDRRSIRASGPYRLASFRQSARDSTGYEMVYGRDKIVAYYYDCRAKTLANSSDGTTPDPTRFKPYEQFIHERPNLPFADANVVALVCR